MDVRVHINWTEAKTTSTTQIYVEWESEKPLEEILQGNGVEDTARERGNSHSNTIVFRKTQNGAIHTMIIDSIFSRSFLQEQLQRSQQCLNPDHYETTARNASKEDANGRPVVWLYGDADVSGHYQQFTKLDRKTITRSYRKILPIKMNQNNAHKNTSMLWSKTHVITKAVAQLTQQKK